ncbi:adenosylmethionine decarboxylase [Thalassotalea aquiviva]|uniref:adenosylmethionine decarboxylase n=1 Tax=Thalassotalea aquiviva TaxID=3242415 RepID=UPI003529E556
MFFEGSEKKAEVTIHPNSMSLLTDVSDDFWADLVKCCNAQILSSISNDKCKAFLLSESSLFVWQDRILILTCGVTHLVKSVEYFIKHIGMDNIAHVFYQRKNEYFAQAQFSAFGDDIKLLNQYMSGRAYRFGELDGHHNYVFHQDNNYQADSDDKTYELLAYQISENASNMLTRPGLSADNIRSFLQLDQLLPGFELDDFVFDPYGYSVNAIKDSDYLTIHITPQAGSSYVSFESSLNLIAMAPKILYVLEPSSFDLLAFNEPEFANMIEQHIPASYISQTKVAETLTNGYQVSFVNYIVPQQHFIKPRELDVTGENHAL